MFNETMQEERAKKVGRYIVIYQSTIRQAAQHFGISKSTVHKDVTKRLQYINMELYKQVRGVLDYNISQRAIRGGEATRRKFKNKK